MTSLTPYFLATSATGAAPSIDLLFESLALACGDRAIGVLLSGGVSAGKYDIVEQVLGGRAFQLDCAPVAKHDRLDNGEPEASPGDGADAQYPVFAKAPLYIRRTLMFPYDDGQRFQHAAAAQLRAVGNPRDLQSERQGDGG